MGETPDAAPEVAPEGTPALAPEDNSQGAYYLVVLTDEDDAPKVHRCSSDKQFGALVSEHVLGATAPVYAFGFKGARIQISAPSAVCTIDVGGEQLPVGKKGTSFEETGRIVPLQTATS